MSREAATAWTLGSDENNALAIREDALRADLVITLA
jgi:hypothetical protein